MNGPKLTPRESVDILCRHYVRLITEGASRESAISMTARRYGVRRVVVRTMLEQRGHIFRTNTGLSLVA